MPEQIADWSNGSGGAPAPAWAALVAVNLAHFSGRIDVALTCVIAGDRTTVHYHHDPDLSFDDVCRMITDELGGVGTAPGGERRGVEAEVAVIVGPDVESPRVEAGLVFGVEPGVDSLRITGRRAAELNSWLDCFLAGLAQLAASVEERRADPLGELDIVPVEQRGRINSLNDTLRETSSPSLLDRFLQNAEHRANEVCLVGRTRDITWKEVRQQAAQIAGWLTTVHGLQAGEAVAVLADRHELCVPTFLGIAMAGGTYVPLSVENPEERNRVILSDAGVELCLTIDDPARAQTAVEDILASQPAILAEPARRAPDSALYVMYTSGSTGVPKGVRVTDANVLGLVDDVDYVELRPDDRIAFLSTPAFDAATFEIWAALANGLSIVAFSRDSILDASKLRQRFVDTGTTVAFVATALFNNLTTQDPSVFGPLRCVLTGGDTCNRKQLQRVLEASPAVKLHHVYGPTENTTFSTWGALELPLDDRPSIGRPLANSTTWIVDANLRLLPVGAIGELVVGGAGVAAGYVNRPDLTAERFIAEFAAGHGEPIYRSGDFARWTLDYEVDFLGRRDHQIKLRGYRVDLEEVRSILESHPAVVAAVVTPHGDNGDDVSQLAAYVVSTTDVLSVEELRAFARDRMPQYMVPSRLLVLDELPLSPNGKVDQRALKAIDFSGPVANAATLDGTVDRVLEVWGEVLDVAVTPDSNWAASGGHSLLLLDLAQGVLDTFGLEFGLPELLALETPSAMAEVIDQRLGAEPGATSPAPASAGLAAGPLPVLPTQRDILFHQLLEPDSTAFHIPVVFELPDGVDIDRLNDAWVATISAHPAARVRFRLDGDDVTQQLGSATPTGLGVESVAPEAADERIHDIVNTPFDVLESELVRGIVVSDDRSAAKLVVVAHHLALDGFSVNQLLVELAARYRGEQPATVTPHAFGAAVTSAAREYAASRERDAEHYASRLQRREPGLRLLLPPISRGLSSQAHLISRRLSPSVYAHLHRLARTLQVSPAAVCLTAVFAHLHRYTGDATVSVGMPVSGRWAPRHASVTGMFANSVLVQHDPCLDSSMGEMIESVADELRSAQAHGHVDWQLVAEHASLDGPPFNVLFSMQNFEAHALDFGLATRPTAVVTPVDGAKYDIALRVQDGGDFYEVGVEYRASVLLDREARQFLDRLVDVLQSIGTIDPETALRDLTSNVGVAS